MQKVIFLTEHFQSVIKDLNLNLNIFTTEEYKDMLSPITVDSILTSTRKALSEGGFLNKLGIEEQVDPESPIAYAESPQQILQNNQLISDCLYCQDSDTLVVCVEEAPKDVNNIGYLNACKLLVAIGDLVPVHQVVQTELFERAFYL